MRGCVGGVCCELDVDVGVGVLNGVGCCVGDVFVVYVGIYDGVCCYDGVGGVSVLVLILGLVWMLVVVDCCVGRGVGGCVVVDVVGDIGVWRWYWCWLCCWC